ncbi:fimbria/pilus periplasmic chaperone [Erwinia sp. CPCC 100877]|nr:fimbria/pilus periplasmic chaperone [Erwinia sp. CPCC 100877]
MRKILAFVAINFFISSSANALIIESLNIDFLPEKEVHFQLIKNNSEQRKNYTLSMVQVDVPREKEHETEIESGELLYSPKQLILAPGESAGFKFYYTGPQDDKERYYRVKFIETPLQAHQVIAKGKRIQTDITVSLEAILIVRPWKRHFQYSFNNGVIRNTGNTYFKYASSRGCSNHYNDSKYIPPGESLNINNKGQAARRMIVYGKKIVSLTNCP